MAVSGELPDATAARPAAGEVTPAGRGTRGRRPRKPAGPRLCLDVMLGAGVGFAGAAVLTVVLLVTRPGDDTLALVIAVTAVDVFRNRFERRLAPERVPVGGRPGAIVWVIATAMISGLVALCVLAVAAALAFHLNTPAWNQRAAAITLMIQFIMLFAMARNGLRRPHTGNRVTG